MIDRPTPETKSFYVTAFDVEEWAEKCICLEKERDEALSQIAQAECRAERFCQERNEAREKAERYRLDANALMLQRDEAREKLSATWQSLRDSQDEVLRLTFENRELRNLEK